ncbi:MAG: ErpK protein [Lachnospiraceae bacterium]|nr:ErpK protein [Lachnospiraceae bacterium]
MRKRQEVEVAKAKAQYDTEVAKLKDLYTKKDEIKKKELLKAVESSEKTYVEIIAFLSGDK